MVPHAHFRREFGTRWACRLVVTVVTYSVIAVMPTGAQLGAFWGPGATLDRGHHNGCPAVAGVLIKTCKILKIIGRCQLAYSPDQLALAPKWHRKM